MIEFNKQLYIGTSGWSYSDWNDNFYPASLERNEQLSYYAQFFETVEINNSFYHIPRIQTVTNWTENVPDNFKFCPKMSKYVTHYQKLQNVDQSLEIFFKAFDSMHKKLGPILIQLPPSVKYENKIVEDFFNLLGSKYNDYIFALEARNNSWFTTEAFDMLTEYNIAWVISLSGGYFPYFNAITSKNIYYRFHGPTTLYNSNYTLPQLKKYAAQIKTQLNEGHRVWVFFNNCWHGYALQNAIILYELITTNIKSKRRREGLLLTLQQ